MTNDSGTTPSCAIASATASLCIAGRPDEDGEVVAEVGAGKRVPAGSEA
jgi:hypothetical protein